MSADNRIHFAGLDALFGASPAPRPSGLPAKAAGHHQEHDGAHPIEVSCRVTRAGEPAICAPGPGGVPAHALRQCSAGVGSVGRRTHTW